LGKVQFKIEYVVDLDDKEMVYDAKEAIIDSLISIYKYDLEKHDFPIKIIEDSTLTKDDIPKFLLENKVDREEG
jgi:hypothetical protein